MPPPSPACALQQLAKQRYRSNLLPPPTFPICCHPPFQLSCPNLFPPPAFPSCCHSLFQLSSSSSSPCCSTVPNITPLTFPFLPPPLLHVMSTQSTLTSYIHFPTPPSKFSPSGSAPTSSTVPIYSHPLLSFPVVTFFRHNYFHSLRCLSDATPRTGTRPPAARQAAPRS